jgi:hypothetical protein
VIRAWAEEEGVSVNSIVVSVLEEFFKRLKKSKRLREELRLELPSITYRGGDPKTADSGKWPSRHFSHFEAFLSMP